MQQVDKSFQPFGIVGIEMYSSSAILNCFHLLATHQKEKDSSIATISTFLTR